MSRLGIGVVGAGRWGCAYLDTLERIPGADVLAVADTDPAARARAAKAYSIGTTADPLEAFADPGIAAVVIATPPDTHLSLTRQSLEAGCHVLVEKPLATSTREAHELAEISREAGLVLAVGHTMLYHPGFSRLRAALQNGEAGRCLSVRTVRTSLGHGSPEPDVIWDLAPHDLAMVIALFGMPTAVKAEFRTEDRSSADCCLLFETELVVDCHVAWHAGSRERRMEVVGSHRTLRFEDQPGSLPFEDRPLTRQCVDFMSCVRTGGRPVSSPELGAAVVESLESLTDSAESNGDWLPVGHKTAVL